MWQAAHDTETDESKLKEYLDDWGLHGATLGLDEDVFSWWIIWRRSNYIVLPFAGGWLDQPWWIRADFLTLDLVRQYYDLQAKKPSIAGLSNPFEQIGA